MVRFVGEMYSASAGIVSVFCSPFGNTLAEGIAPHDPADVWAPASRPQVYIDTWMKFDYRQNEGSLGKEGQVKKTTDDGDDMHYCMH